MVAVVSWRSYNSPLEIKCLGGVERWELPWNVVVAVALLASVAMG